MDRGLLTVAALAVGLSSVTIWWALAAIGAAFLAGLRMERARPAVVVLGCWSPRASWRWWRYRRGRCGGRRSCPCWSAPGWGPGWWAGSGGSRRNWCGPGGSGRNGPSANSNWSPSRPGCVNGRGSRRTCTTPSATT
ncbi:hypothetical protein ACFQ0M_01200 [Kitasatospora aburaviensis]